MDPDEVAGVLSRTSIFAPLSRQRVREILDTHGFPTSTFDTGRVVAQRGDVYEELLIILTGELQAEINDIEGHTLTVETLVAPQVVASAVYFSSERRFPVSLIAKSPVSLLRIPRPAVLSLLRANEGALQALLTDMGDRLQFLAQRLRMNQFGSIRQKLAVYLLDLITSTGHTTARIPHTRQELADLFGVARPSVSRVISELEEEGLVTTSGRDLRVRDVTRIEQLAREIRRG
jgi:CRP-like cAMP-binding protein